MKFARITPVDQLNCRKGSEDRLRQRAGGETNSLGLLSDLMTMSSGRDDLDAAGDAGAVNDPKSSPFGETMDLRQVQRVRRR